MIRWKRKINAPLVLVMLALLLIFSASISILMGKFILFITKKNQMTNEKRETVSKIAGELQKKAADNTHSAHEQMLEQLTEYDDNLAQCVKDALKTKTGDFYVVVLTKKERLMENVLRNYFFSRNSCPTPDYDQAVYFYSAQEQQLKFMWVIPSKDTCEFMRDNAKTIDPSEYELLKFVMSFYDGYLLKLVKKLNNETENTGQLILN